MEEDSFGEDFNNMSVDEQMSLLKDMFNLGESFEEYDKGRVAEKARALRRGMKLDGLFKSNTPFMNVSLRDFLNLNNDGSDNY